MLNESFRRHYEPDGWRHSLSYRTRPWILDGEEQISWPVERLSDGGWVRVGNGRTYDDARQIATDDWHARTAHFATEDIG